MSTAPTSLSAGMQALYNSGLLPSNLTSAELQNASSSELAQISISSAEAEASAALFGDSASSNGDSVALSPSVEAMLLGTKSSAAESTSSASTDPILEALEASQMNAGDAALTGATSVPPNGTGGVSAATLFSYLG
jgi:hypothetical protein